MFSGKKDEISIKYSAGVKHFVHILGEMGAEISYPGCVVGCGDGSEVLYLENKLELQVFGLDLSVRNIHCDNLKIIQSDALLIPLPSDSVGFVFCHHVLEHVSDPDRCLKEIYRILVPGGLLYLGTPNKRRVIGYLGSRTARWQDKFLWNIKDYHARILGRFENELGAHAGFTDEELFNLASRYFESTRLTEQYLSFKYGQKLPGFLMAIVLNEKLIGRLSPSNYLLCEKAN
jgi:SAM-dependent methyltransferase